MLIRYLTIVSLLYLLPLRGQGVVDSVRVTLDTYTSLRSHYAVIETESEFQDNASRIGFVANVKNTNSNMRFFGHVELSMRLIESTVNLNTDSRTSSGFIILNEEQERQVFAARLGYMGVDLGKYGVITVGKQWSTYYDITKITDKFNVFGGTASNTYVGASDGSIGTGRSDQALIYRNRLGKWNLGAQMLFSSTLNDAFVDGYGLSVRYHLFPHLIAGAAYQTSLISDELFEGTVGLNDDPKYFSAGINYFKNNLYLAAVYAWQTNGDVTVGLLNEEETPSVVYDDTGFEFAANYRWNKFRFLAGINLEWPDTEGLPINQDYHTEDYLFGVEYHASRLAYFYSEYRVEFGEGPVADLAPDVFTIGLRIDLSHEFKKTMVFDP